MQKITQSSVSNMTIPWLRFWPTWSRLWVYPTRAGLSESPFCELMSVYLLKLLYSLAYRISWLWQKSNCQISILKLHLNPFDGCKYIFKVTWLHNIIDFTVYLVFSTLLTNVELFTQGVTWHDLNFYDYSVHFSTHQTNSHTAKWIKNLWWM